ncbi:partial Valine--tRNA ligase, partial [Candidatus Brocadiaceae bacterium]
EINNASKIIYSLVWNDFCDWFVELSKIKFNDENPEVRSAALTRAIDWFGNILQVVHPFMPFITEEVWHLIQERGENNSISTSKYPEYQESLIDLKAEQDMEGLQDIITAIRNIRGEKNIPMSKPIIVHIKTSAVSERVIPFIKKLTKASEVIIGESIVVPEKSATTVIRLAEIFIPLEGLIDTDAERKRIEKEIQRLEGLLFAVEKKLSNEGFVAKAPAEVIEKERAKQTDWKESIEKLKIAMNSLGA